MIKEKLNMLWIPDIFIEFYKLLILKNDMSMCLSRQTICLSLNIWTDFFPDQ